MKPLLATAVLVSLLVAGCTGAQAPATANPVPTRAPDGQFNDDTGAIVGQVVDPEFLPVADAELLVLGTDLRTRTALDGSFSISFVPPGNHKLVAAKLGYHSGQAQVKVEAGQKTDLVEVVLTPLPVLQPRMVLDQFTGLITCSIGVPSLLSEECGTGVGTPVGHFGANDRNKIDWRFNVTTLEGLTSIFLELDWVPQSAAATKLGFNVAHNFKCTPSCSGTPRYCNVFQNYGPPVLTCHIAADKLGIKNPETELPWDITARAWAAPVKATDNPPVNVVLEQTFTMYRTEFYDMEKPQDYTAVPPK
jgi:hypothetical protein